MRQVLPFIAVFFTGVLHSFPVEPDGPLDIFSLDPDPLAESADNNLDTSYQTAEADDLFSFIEPDDLGLYDLNNPILASDEASSTVSQCVGDSTEPVTIARSLEPRQPFDIADQGLCPKDGRQETPPKLNFPPTLQDLYNLDKVKPEGEEPLLSPLPGSGFWYCLAGDTMKVVCCEGTVRWDSSRDGCEFCKFEKQFSSVLNTSSGVFLTNPLIIYRVLYQPKM